MTADQRDEGVGSSLALHQAHPCDGRGGREAEATIADAEASSARSELSTAGLTRARDNALLAYAAGRSATLEPPANAEPTAIEGERQLVVARIDEYRGKRDSIEERRAGAIASEEESQAEIGKLRRTLPLLREALDLQMGLERQGFGSRQKLLQQQQAYVTAEQDLKAQIAKIAEARAQIASIGGEAAQAREEFISRAAQERAEAEGTVSTKGDIVREANQKRGMQRLTAPVSGARDQCH